MKTTLLVPLALLTRSAAIPTRKGERKWRRGIEYYRQHEKVEHAKHLRRRIKWIGALGVLAKGGENYEEEEEAYDPAAYGMEAALFENRQLAANASLSGYCPPGDVVTCVNGFATSAGNVTYNADTVTCQDACDGKCCVGNGNSTGGFNAIYPVGTPTNSCTGFNGKVCKSGAIPSCSDNRTQGDPILDRLGRACYRANITEVVNGCNGRQACARAGYNGDLGRVVNGCYGGDFSCVNAAYKGYIKEIVDSCIGKEACKLAAALGGNISSITNGSCVGKDSCYRAADFGGFIGYINQGCRGVEACYYAAYGYYGFRSIGGISYACNNNKACQDLASSEAIRGPFSSVNSSTIVSCCNSESECTGSKLSNGVLPDQCGTSSPTSSPTTEPTGSPITASPSSPPTQMPTTASPSVSPTNTPTTASPSSSPTHMPSQQPTQVPTVAPSTNPTSLPSMGPTDLPTTQAPSDPPTIGPTASPTAKARGGGSEKSRAVLLAKGKGRRRLADFSDDASAECVKAAEDTTKELVEACLEPPNEERVSSVSTVGVVRSVEEEVLTFTQDVTIIESEVAVSFNDLTACIDESVVDGNATVTLRSSAKKNGCFELEDGTVEGLTLTEEADTPTSTPISQDESSDVASASGKSGKSSSAVPGISKASKKSEASSKASKSVKSAKAEPQESAEQDEVGELEESVKLDVEEEEDPEEVTEDEEEVTEDEEEVEEEGFFDMLAKLLGGWW